MQKLRFFLTFILCLSLVGEAYAQQFEVPKNYKLVAKADYARYEKRIIACVKWLEATPWAEQESKRTEAKAFLLKWLTGSPTVIIELREPVNKLTDQNPELLTSYLGGYARYVLENDKNKAQASLAAVQALLLKYTKEPTAARDKEVEKLQVLAEQGKLEAWVQENLID
jgi:hypothetical protein